MKSTSFKKEIHSNRASFLALSALAGTLLASQPGIAIGAEVLSCFYECKPVPTTTPGIPPTAWMETTTIMIGNSAPHFGQHVNTHIAHLLFLDGNENPILRTRTGLSGWDLDEVHVCRTLHKAGVAVPPAGLIQIGVTPITATTPPAPEGSVNAWMKNLLGKFGFNDDDPFVSGRVGSLGKTNCNHVPPSVAGPSLDRIISVPVPAGQSILIERTADPTIFPIVD